jgi:radical SAM protein with 4Fe4S-binding SPASM domain
MSIETFKTVVGKFPELKSIELYNWGEPFLNSELFDMIEYAKKLKIFVTVHTNFSFKKSDDFFVSLAKKGPHLLVFSLDGASQESYSKFRVNGNFQQVIDNIKKLKDFQKQLNANNSVLMWKFLVNKYNEHEISVAKEIAKEIGIRIRFLPMFLGDDMVDIPQKETLEERKEKWLPADQAYILEQYKNVNNGTVNKGICNQLFKQIVINPDGRVFPCCTITDENNVFGNILTESLEDIWYSKKYEYSRGLFVSGANTGNTEETICSTCNNYKKL